MVNYAIVGGGRLARHLSHYFNLLAVPHSCWTRDHRSGFNTHQQVNAELRLHQTIEGADVVLLLVSDSAISAVLKQYPFLHDKQLIHCSGALSIPGVWGVHPLMTFADDLYGLDTYQTIPFMCEHGCDFNELFPGLVNPHYSIAVEDKARYHAMCVMAGNFSQILWKAASQRFEQQFDLPASTLTPYLHQLADNFIRSPGSALTGPLVRGDQAVIERNTKALDGDPLKNLYTAFVDFYQAGEKPVSDVEQPRMEKSA
jgi:predicted short-subunit dehydrogenase-like oxidoreductase (DUF2520 family)